MIKSLSNSHSHLLYSGASDKTIKIWNIKKLELQTSFIAHDDPVCTLAISNARLFSGSLRSIKVSSIAEVKGHLQLLCFFNIFVGMGSFR